jgi:CrcB protein
MIRMTTPTLDRQAHDRAASRPLETAHRQHLLIAVGAILGVLVRFLVGEWSTTHLALDFPLGTLLINLVGCLLIGIVQTVCFELRALRRETQLFLAVGVLGGFTTFSTLSIETVRLLQAGRVTAALTYQALSLVGGLAAVAIGIGVTLGVSRWLGRRRKT